MEYNNSSRCAETAMQNLRKNKDENVFRYMEYNNLSRCAETAMQNLRKNKSEKCN